MNNLWMIQDYGANYDSGTATHSLVIYRAVSGALVFGAGTGKGGGWEVIKVLSSSV